MLLPTVQLPWPPCGRLAMCLGASRPYSLPSWPQSHARARASGVQLCALQAVSCARGHTRRRTRRGAALTVISAVDYARGRSTRPLGVGVCTQGSEPSERAPKRPYSSSWRRTAPASAATPECVCAERSRTCPCTCLWSYLCYCPCPAPLPGTAPIPVPAAPVTTSGACAQPASASWPRGPRRPSSARAASLGGTRRSAAWAHAPERSPRAVGQGSGAVAARSPRAMGPRREHCLGASPQGAGSSL